MSYLVSPIPGIAFSVANTVGNIPGFVGPAVVGALLTDYSEVTQWRTVFWISLTVHLVGSLLYLVRGSDSLQDWARPIQTIEGGQTEKSEKKTEL